MKFLVIESVEEDITMKFRLVEAITEWYQNDQEVLTEGTKYDKIAAGVISKSGLFDEETSAKIIDGLFRQDIHAFVHSPAWLEKYLVGIARMLVDEANGDKVKAKAFLEECPEVFDKFLIWVRENREKMPDEEKAKFDNEFRSKASYQGVKDFVDKIQSDADAKSSKELADMEFDKSQYTLVPIESYEDFHAKYGGRLTGDGSSDKAAGRGGTAWCHANGEWTYDSWVEKGRRFFVLQRNDWKDIHFNPETNKKMYGKDDYGNSLIAILVGRRGNLLNATLRANHEGLAGSPNSLPDNQYKTYAELSKIAGFNVEEEVKKCLGDIVDIDASKCFKVSSGGKLYWDSSYAESVGVELSELTEYTIPDGVTIIGDGAFFNCSNLTSIVIPDSVTVIESDAFYNCTGLSSLTMGKSVWLIGTRAFRGCAALPSIDFPDSVTSIGDFAFYGCRGLPSLAIPDSVKSIGQGAFDHCTGLINVDIGKSVTSIGDYAFAYCERLSSITFPDSVTSIRSNVFYQCHSLPSFEIPDSVTSIGVESFGYCTGLKSIKIPDGVTSVGYEAFAGCRGLTSVTIPNSVKIISSRAFEYCTSLTIRCHKGSYAEAYAKMCGIPFEYINEQETDQ